MVNKNKYIPQKGDLVWLNFTPQAGREQKGHRPALVVSSTHYNKTGLMLACPITNQSKDYPFEVQIQTTTIKGVVLADHLKNQDWQARKVKFICKAPKKTLSKVQRIIAALLTQ